MSRTHPRLDRERRTVDAMIRLYCRNPLIAEVFYRAGLIEKWGRGTN